MVKWLCHSMKVSLISAIAVFGISAHAVDGTVGRSANSSDAEKTAGESIVDAKKLPLMAYPKASPKAPPQKGKPQDGTVSAQEEARQVLSLLTEKDLRPYGVTLKCSFGWRQTEAAKPAYRYGRAEFLPKAKGLYIPLLACRHWRKPNVRLEYTRLKGWGDAYKDLVGDREFIVSQLRAAAESMEEWVDQRSARRVEVSTVIGAEYTFRTGPRNVTVYHMPYRGDLYIMRLESLSEPDHEALAKKLSTSNRGISFF